MDLNRTSFIVTIDVEADNVWADPTSLTLKNLRYLEDFHMMCNKYNIIPSYLLSYETLFDEDFISFLKGHLKTGSCEVGMHPHIWTVPPYDKEKNGIDINVIRYYQSMLSKDILFEKLNFLKRTIEEKIDNKVTSHRAGRWGLCARTIEWLEENDFVADTSVVPFKSFKDSTIDSAIYPEYYNAPSLPYRMSSNGLIRKGKLSLVQVPVTNINHFTVASIVRFADMVKKIRGGTRLRKILNKLSMYPLELRPYPEYSKGTLPKIAKIALKKNLPIINLMFHSSELILKGSPYSNTKENTEKIWKHIENLFQYINNMNIQSTSLSGSVKKLIELNYF